MDMVRAHGVLDELERAEWVANKRAHERAKADADASGSR